MPIKITGKHRGETVATEYMTVGELVARLQEVDQTLPVGRIGHFGELHSMIRSDFRPSTAFGIDYMTWKGAETEKPFPCFCIDAPDIGEEPD